MKSAGERDKRVVIEQKQTTKNGIGEEVVTWVTFDTRWASVKPIRGREFFAAQQTQSAVEYRVNLLKPLALTQDMRLKAGLLLGLISGYRAADLLPLASVSVAASVPSSAWWARVSYLPKPPGGASSGLHFSIERQF